MSKFRGSKNEFYGGIVALVFGGIFAIFAVVSLVNLPNEIARRENMTEKTTARVAKSEVGSFSLNSSDDDEIYDGNKTGKLTCKTVLEFFVGEQKFGENSTETDYSVSQSDFNLNGAEICANFIGKTYEIRYNPKNPSSFEKIAEHFDNSAGGTIAQTMVPVVISLILLALGIFFLLDYKKKKNNFANNSVSGANSANNSVNNFAQNPTQNPQNPNLTNQTIPQNFPNSDSQNPQNNNPWEKK